MAYDDKLGVLLAQFMLFQKRRERCLPLITGYIKRQCFLISSVQIFNYGHDNFLGFGLLMFSLLVIYCDADDFPTGKCKTDELNVGENTGATPWPSLANLWCSSVTSSNYEIFGRYTC